MGNTEQVSSVYQHSAGSPLYCVPGGALGRGWGSLGVRLEGNAKSIVFFIYTQKFLGDRKVSGPFSTARKFPGVSWGWGGPPTTEWPRRGPPRGRRVTLVTLHFCASVTRIRQKCRFHRWSVTACDAFENQNVTAFCRSNLPYLHTLQELYKIMGGRETQKKWFFKNFGIEYEKNTYFREHSLEARSIFGFSTIVAVGGRISCDGGLFRSVTASRKGGFARFSCDVCWSRSVTRAT